MIRFANTCDFTQIVALWKECFPHDDEYADWYFANQYDAKYTIVYELDGIIAAVLQRLPYLLKNIGQVSYIYGACTHPSYRRKGIMAELIEYSHELDLSLNIKASILIPQDENLFEYYKKFGYQPVFKIFRKNYQKQNPSQNYTNFRICNNNDICQINRMYESIAGNSNYVLRDSDYLTKQISMFKASGGDVFCLEHEGNITAYAFVWKDSSIYIQDLLGINDDVKQILCNKILEYYNLDAIESASITDNPQSLDYGCIKLYSSESRNTDLPFIMSLMFD